MSTETSLQQRTRLAAGLLHCDEEQVRPVVNAMNADERKSLTRCIDWLVDYEAAEAIASSTP